MEDLISLVVAVIFWLLVADFVSFAIIVFLQAIGINI